MPFVGKISPRVLQRGQRARHPTGRPSGCPRTTRPSDRRSCRPSNTPTDGPTDRPTERWSDPQGGRYIGGGLASPPAAQGRAGATRDPSRLLRGLAAAAAAPSGKVSKVEPRGRCAPSPAHSPLQRCRRVRACAFSAPTCLPPSPARAPLQRCPRVRAFCARACHGDALTADRHDCMATLGRASFSQLRAMELLCLIIIALLYRFDAACAGMRSAKRRSSAGVAPG